LNSYKEQTICMLKEIDPPAVMGEDYLERPEDGWIICEDCFVGVGYHGNTSGSYSCEWKPDRAGRGFIPTEGYG